MQNNPLQYTVVKIKLQFQSLTSKIEPWWSIVGAPIIEEFIFRFLPYLIFSSYGGFWIIGIISSAVFGAIHWHFGKWFVLYAFLGGIVLWFIMVNYGLLYVIILHSLVNIIEWKIGLLPKLKQKFMNSNSAN